MGRAYFIWKISFVNGDWLNVVVSILGVTMSVQGAMVSSVGNEPPEPQHTIIGEIIGVAIQKTKRCNHCHQTQENFKEEAWTHKCEKCKLLQRSQSYACILSGRIVVLSTGEETTLILKSPVITKYLHANNLVDLMENSDSLEKHFVGNVQFQVSYAGDVVSDLTTIDRSIEK